MGWMGSSGMKESREARDLYKMQAEIGREAWDTFKTKGLPAIDDAHMASRDYISRMGAVDPSAGLDNLRGMSSGLAERGRELAGGLRERVSSTALPALLETGDLDAIGAGLDGLGTGDLDALAASMPQLEGAGDIALHEGRAATDVKQAYGRQRRSLINQMGRYGMRPGSGRFVSAMRSLALGQAGDAAGAKTNARIGVLDRNRALEERNFARGLGLAGARTGRALGVAGARTAAAGARTGRAAAAGGLEASMAGINQRGAMAAADLETRTGASDLAVHGALADTEYGRTLDIENRILSAAHGGASLYTGMPAIATSGVGSAAGGLGQIGANKAAANAAGWSGVGNLAGSLGAAAILKYSDRALKRNIAPIGELPNGLIVYEFTYIDDPEMMFTGLMADEVLEVMPQHVGSHRGFLTVDYGALIEEICR